MKLQQNESIFVAFQVAVLVGCVYKEGNSTCLSAVVWPSRLSDFVLSVKTNLRFSKRMLNKQSSFSLRND